MKPICIRKRLFDIAEERSLMLKAKTKRYILNIKASNWTKNRCILLIYFLILFCISGCSSNNETKQPIPTVTEAPKSLLEQAVDWGNENLFYSTMNYDSFTLEEKLFNNNSYNFLTLREGSFWECELFYIAYEDNQVQKLYPCGGGNVELFSYELVTLSGSCYVAVNNASHMGNGGLELYPIDHPEEAAYIINNVIDKHFEGMALEDDKGNTYSKSEIYDGGKLLPEYRDKNEDGYTDITLTGTKLVYEDPIGETSNSIPKETWTCVRTYYYNEETDSFIIGDDSEELIESEQDKLYNYTGYLDLNSHFADNNPVMDYDGDGSDDRIFKEFDEDKGNDTITLEFGNGTELQLSDNTLGLFFKTECADLTGDGQKEILFEQTGMGTGGMYLYVSIFTFEDGRYVRMKNPYVEIDASTPNAGGMFGLPLIIEKLNDYTARIYQPDSGYQGEITTKKFIDGDGSIYDEMEHLYSPEMEEKCLTYSVSSLKLVEGDENRTALRFQSKLGDKWIYYFVYWELEYIDDQWMITKVNQPLPIRKALGVEYISDLNGDNQKDVIFYDIKIEKQDGFEREIPVLTVNGKEFNGIYLEKECGILMADCSQIGYYLMDIDISDSFSEIAILDEGVSSDPKTYFLRYDGEKIEYCGAVTDFPENRSFSIDGEGTIKAQKRLDLLHTWYSTAEWKYNQKGLLEEQLQDFYYTYWSPEDEDKQNIAKKNLILFQNPDIYSDAMMIKKGEKLYLTATDNKNWIQISDSSGNQGWFYLHDGAQVTLPGGEGKIGDIIAYLNMAD